MENAVQQPKPNRLRAVLLAILGVVAIGAVLWTTVLPMIQVGRPDSKKFQEQMAMNVEQVSPDGSAQGASGETMLDGSAQIEAAPTGDRHDPFKPLVDPKKPETPAGKPGKPSLGPPPTDSGDVPTLPNIGSAGGFEPAPGLPAVPDAPQKPVPVESHDPIVMQGTAVGMESIVLFKRGNEILERRVGDYLGPYRITEIDHGKIRLIDEQKNTPWMESGQFLIPGGSGPTRFDPSAATREPRPAPSTTVNPRSAAPSSSTFSAAPAAVRLSDNRWPSTVR
jgi:hypothetical protein